MAPAEPTEEERRQAAEAAAAKAAADREAALDAFNAKHAADHAQALGVANIKVLVPITLDRVANNYDRWRKVFLVTLGKYVLDDHVLSDDAHPTRSHWRQMDCTVLSWIYGTIKDDLQQQVMLKEPTARAAWIALDDEFLGQRESRALLLSAEFRQFKQGALTITDYCRRLETMASALAEYGDPVNDRTLVLTMIRGLNEKFRHMMSHLKFLRPFPTFAAARTLLLLEEIDLNNVIGDTPPNAPALYASGGSSCGGAPQRSTGGPPSGQAGGYGGNGGGQQGGNGGQRNNRRRGRNKNNADGGAAPGNQGAGQGTNYLPSPTPPLAPVPTPWGGMLQFWPYGLGGAALHSPASFQQPPAALHAQQQPYGAP
jgi:hypothetical protein